MSRLPVVSRLTDALIAASLPVQCVSDNGNGTYTVTLQPGSTQLQQTQADALVASYIDAPRRPRNIQTIFTALTQLTTAQQNKIIGICCAYIIQQNPSFATLVSVALSGDEPDV